MADALGYFPTPLPRLKCAAGAAFDLAAGAA
jgi:hypothetical protein